MELTNELKILLVQTGPHTNAQAVIDNIENTKEIDADEAWASRLNNYIEDKQLGTPTADELKTSLLANPYVPIKTASIWELEKYESEAAWTAKQYARDRKAEYNKLNQDEMRYDDIKNSTTTWVDAIDAIKAKYPKP